MEEFAKKVREAAQPGPRTWDEYMHKHGREEYGLEPEAAPPAQTEQPPSGCPKRLRCPQCKKLGFKSQDVWWDKPQALRIKCSECGEWSFLSNWLKESGASAPAPTLSARECAIKASHETFSGAAEVWFGNEREESREYAEYLQEFTEHFDEAYRAGAQETHTAEKEKG